MIDRVPMFGQGLTPSEIRAKARGITFRGYAHRRSFVSDDRPTIGQELRRHSAKRAADELGGIFIDRLYASGEDLEDDPVSEGARMLGQAGDDE